jgi:Tfp pilus assembly protein PilF
MDRIIVAFGIWVSLACCASAWASEEAAGHNEAAAQLFRQGKVIEAVAEFKQALEKDAKYLPARLNLAHAYEALNRPDEAAEEYRALIALEPENFFAHNNLGVIYDKKKRYDEAIAEFEKALQIEPGNAMALNNLATAKNNKAIVQDRQTQIQRAEKAAQAKPKDPQASYQVARLHAAYGNKDQALRWLGRAFKQGYKERVALNTDPAFKNLRDDRDFELMLLGK